jgi:hypothetical protein
MNFEKSELTQQVADTARDFAQQHIKPYVMQWMKPRNFHSPFLRRWENWD